MAFTGMQATINLCIVREGQLTNELTDIMTQMTQACRETAQQAEEVSAAKRNIRTDYEYGVIDDTTYQDRKDEVQEEYELALAQLTAWESELESQKNELETEIQATTAYKESFLSAAKQNIQKDFKYGGN